MDSFFENIKGYYDFNNQNCNNCVNIKIVLAADAAVGKTAFILRLQNKNYNDYMKKDRKLGATIGTDFYRLILYHKGINVKLMIFDTVWINSPTFNLDGCLQEADIIFLFYESSSKYSFKAIQDKKYYFDNYCKRNKILALIRNKYDKGIEEISDEEALEFADKNNMLFFHLSLHTKNETGIKELFENVLDEYFRRKEKKENE